MKRVALVGLASGLVVAIGAACGGEVGSTPATVTVVRTDASEPSAPSGSIKVPDVVGLDHQLAQDTMQAAGLYNLSEDDASGEGRLLIWDRNWTVVEQSPAAGSMVNEDQTIVLRSLKDDEV